jgi:hypothetical protein
MLPMYNDLFICVNVVSMRIGNVFLKGGSYGENSRES